jgi:hypothetical protein
MTGERKQVLDMLAEGKITVEDADRLLDKLSSGDSRGADSPRSVSNTDGARLKFLRVVVDSTDGDKVNIRIPISLIRTGIKLTTVLPDNVNEQLGDKGVDLSALSELAGDELDRALRDLQVDVDSGDGDVVRIFCE